MPGRPRVRGECLDGPRPCPWVSCRYHLAVDLGANNVLRVRDLETMTDTCALDVADRGSHTVDELGAVLGMSHQGASHAVDVALRRTRLRRALEVWQGHRGDEQCGVALRSVRYE